MKKLTSAATILFVAGVISASCLSGCTSKQESDFDEGQAYSKNKEWRRAAQYYDQAIKRDSQTPVAIKAMKEAARIQFLEIKEDRKSVG